MPYLFNAHRVVIVSIAKKGDRVTDSNEVGRNTAWHGIKARDAHHCATRSTKPYFRTEQIDFLVAGARS
jgi:hypothetical protein